jgi:hypothetical protein
VLLDRLIDHAALFPPASMSLDDALAEDREARASPHAELLGRFVVPAARLGELPPDHPPLSVILESAADAELVAQADRVEAVELALSAPRPESAEIVAAYRALRPLGVETYFELVLDESWRDSVPWVIGAVATVSGRVKLRCGGATIPTIDQVALVITWCREEGVSLKATAGLHHAVRRGDEHGFLNLLAAATAPGDRVRAVLAEEDAGALELEAAGRRTFTSFGSCSWREPIDDLVELGLLS